ncbi:hypothetical protein, partial [Escherichia coli]|uniref:hypothetical protein n=1 Tax=Escherichia coli TaxID=562 RepID=UPI003C2D65E5
MRFWTRDLGLSGEIEEKTKELVTGWPSFSAVSGLTIFLSLIFLLPALLMLASGSGVAFLGAVMFSFWALMMYCTVFVPRSTLKQAFQKPLTAQEVESLMPSARGRLDRAYLSLVL